jgi:hypothetical protein
MADDSENTQLLREIRDLLAAQESKYQQHLKDIKATYAEQLQMGEQSRKKSVRNIFIAIILMLAGMAAILLTQH